MRFGPPLVAVLVLLVVLHNTWHRPVTAESLGASVPRLAGPAVCKPAGPDRWMCSSPNAEYGSGYTTLYDVRVRPGSSCWTAHATDQNDESFSGLPTDKQGCVTGLPF